MDENIGIGMPGKAVLIRNLHTTYPQVTILNKLMYINAKTDSYHSRRNFNV